MTISIREKREVEIVVGGETFVVEVIEIPFREGVELRCLYEGEELRMSDRQLGEREAFRLLEEEILRRQGMSAERTRGATMKAIRNYFGGAENLSVDGVGDATPEDLQLAAAVLLVEANRDNKRNNVEESRSIFKNIEAEFKLTPEATHRLLELAERSPKNEETMNEFVDSINASFTDAQKQRILAMVWRVIMADGVVDHYENVYAVTLRSRLNLTLEQSIRARRMAEGAEDLTLEQSTLAPKEG